MSDFVVYGSPLSPFVRKVEAVLHHAGAAYEFEAVNIFDMPDWFVEISPARRIPVLRDKTIATEGIPGTIADSSAICLFLEKRLQAGLFGSSAYEGGRAAWFEEYADTVLAQPTGMGLFRPIIFPRFSGKPSDVEAARKTWADTMPKLFDYLETALDDRPFFLGDTYSIADISVGAQMTQIALILGLPDAGRWPALARHTEEMKTRPGFRENLATCSGLISAMLPQKVQLD